MGSQAHHPVQFVLREYLRLLWADSDWQADWQRVRRGKMEFLQFERKWRLPRTLRRILIDASSEPEEPSLERLQEKIPAIGAPIGFFIITADGIGRWEPPLPEKPLQSLPEAEPSVETREEYLQRVRWVLARELDYEQHFEGIQRWVEAIPDEARREAYLNALQERKPQLLPEFREKHPDLTQEELEQQVLLEAMRYYEACLQAVKPKLMPKRFRGRRHNPDYLKQVAVALYLRIVKRMSYAEIQFELARRGFGWIAELATIQRECAFWRRELEIP